MATNVEMATDTLREEMKNLAIENQQCFYELLPDCTMYKPDEHKYLKQNIGYAIYFGSSKDNEAANTTENSYSNIENQNEDAEVTDAMNYDEDAKKVIEIIFNKICECTIGTDNAQPIYLGVIYNVILPIKMKAKSMKKEPKEAKKETEMEVKETEATGDMEQLPIVTLTPIFKIWKSIKKKSTFLSFPKEKKGTSNEDETDCEIWYIDTDGRVYNNWTDYTTNNILPKCTMILPKDGCYQADPENPITEDYSTVWLEIIDSPACAWAKKFYNGMDIVSGVAGISTAGLTIASMFTPLAPVVALTALTATGACTGVWTIGRCSQQLVDRGSHKESIHPLNKDAFPQWLAITGTAIGLGVIGGSAAISTAVARGMTVNTIAKAAFNVAQGGSLVLNGVGIAYQSYCMIDKYRTKKTLSYMDALNLATHLMFFAGSVVKIQFAGDIIENTQGKVLKDYRETLHTRRLRKKFYRVQRQAAANNTCRLKENAEVIQYIRNRNGLLSSGTSTFGSVEINKASRICSFESGNLIINGINLLNPIDYVIRLINSDIFNEVDRNNSSSSQNYTNDPNFTHLMKVLENLLTKFYSSRNYPESHNLPRMPNFEPLLRDMSSVNIDEDFLKKLFEIGVKLMQRSRSMDDFLNNVLCFLWSYCKANLRQWGIKSYRRIHSYSASRILQKIIVAIFEAIDMMLNNLCYAFEKYMAAKLKQTDHL